MMADHLGLDIMGPRPTFWGVTMGRKEKDVHMEDFAGPMCWKELVRAV